MLIKMAWKNIIHKPLNSILCVCLLLFGVSIISVLILIQHQLEQKFERDLENIDLVVGAKGSPLQLVLSAVYHIDAPTGNINFAEAKTLMNNPMVEEAIPMAYGDSYHGYRILGTTEDYLNKYSAQFREGHIFQKSMQAVLGAKVARTSKLKIGDTFYGSHGQVEGVHVHNEYAYQVVGILENTNSVVDNLVLTNIESVWEVHNDNHGHEPEAEEAQHSKNHEEHEHHDDSENEREHEHKTNHEHEINHKHEGNHEHQTKQVHENESKLKKSKTIHNPDSLDITAVLLKYKTRNSAMGMPRYINQQTNMQAVIPALEVNRLFYMLGVGTTTLKWIAGGIIFMAGFSVFLVLYSRLRERQYELALMRSVGYRTKDLFGLLLYEGLLLAGIGYIFGWLLSRIGLYFISRQAENDFNLHFGGQWINEEISLLFLTIFIGVVASLLPAWKAMRMDVSAKLSKQ